jgi:hypothetical protein
MSNRKNYNSIVFLTTLSVYLGLVLAGGASPSVLAQAALTRDFDIKNEIVVEDDLDKKPDDEVNEALERIENAIDSGFITESVRALLEDLKKLRRIEKYDGEQRFEIDFLFRRDENSNKHQVDKVEGGGNRWLFTACEEPAYLIEHNFDEVVSSNFHVYDESLKEKVNNANVKFLSENGELTLQIASRQKSREEAQNLAVFFSEIFARGSSGKDLQNYERVIYENTKAHTENNQVFIVTRLPRASIDALSAENNAR